MGFLKKINMDKKENINITSEIQQTMNYCPMYGNQVSVDAAFCSCCGNSLRKKEEKSVDTLARDNEIDTYVKCDASTNIYEVMDFFEYRYDSLCWAEFLIERIDGKDVLFYKERLEENGVEAIVVDLVSGDEIHYNISFTCNGGTERIIEKIIVVLVELLGLKDGEELTLIKEAEFTCISYDPSEDNFDEFIKSCMGFKEMFEGMGAEFEILVDI